MHKAIINVGIRAEIWYDINDRGVRIMEKNAHLADIYIKIYHKRTLTMEDLAFLSKYDPECFVKTCQNIVYNLPEAEEILQMETEVVEQEQKLETKEVVSKKQNIDIILGNLKKMEMKELPVKKVKSETVKQLLGNLYMELLFPHSGENQYFDMKKEEEESRFNKRV